MNISVHDYFTLTRNDCNAEWGGYLDFKIAMKFAEKEKKEHPDSEIIIKKVTEIECEVTRI